MSSILGTINPNASKLTRPLTSESKPHHDNPNLFPEQSSQTSDSNSEPLKHGADEQVHHTDEIVQLARRLTQQSHAPTTRSHSEENPITGTDENSPLNPNGSKFDPKAWIHSMIAVTSRDSEKYPARTSGISFRNLSVHGFGSPTDYQNDVGNIVFQLGGMMRSLVGAGKQKIQILREFDGIVESGEMLMVLGRPGSGCSTLLKTIAGETHGIYISGESSLNYQGISPKQMHNDFRGEAIYNAETDIHFPQLTVGQTLSFAARARAPRNPPFGASQNDYAKHMTAVMLAVFGLKHTEHTQVGNEYIRGVSGGERKRVSIAEALLSGSPLQCWDNSTRGLDSANALEFCRTLRLATSLGGASVCLAIYQASQSAYDVFDKVTVLYEGRQIYFGRTTDAKDFFFRMGFACPDRQTTADFLTSLTSPAERTIRQGYEDKAPRTPDEFVEAWKKSSEYSQLVSDIEAYDKKYPIGGEALAKFVASRKAQMSKAQRIKSPYTLSLYGQVRLCMRRGFDRLRGDMSLLLTGLIGNLIMSVIVSSVFYNLQSDTNSFFSRGALLFFAVLLNAFASALEILTLYAQRPIVEKHTRYALYHPTAEAISSMLCDMPNKISNAIMFNLTLYFLTNLRREPGPFFVFLLFTFSTTLAMSMIFRTIAASSRSLAQALAPAAIILLALMIYTGFVVPISSMGVWFRWINYIDPIAYAFESLMVNEFDGRMFPCAQYIPQGGQYNDVGPNSRVCSVVGAIAGTNDVSGGRYIEQTYRYFPQNKWRNFGIIWAFIIFFMFVYLFATEYISAKKSKGEVLVFRRGQMKSIQPAKTNHDIEAQEKKTTSEKESSELTRQVSAVIQKQTAIFHWKDVCFDIKVKGGERRLLDMVDGWVQPGTLTALMGESGAGKTTLLDVLATRVTIGVVQGEMLVDGQQRDDSFQRKTGYVQQQDLHLSTSTVREALEFSALLRQPARFTRQAKLDYVDEVIKLLEMDEYSNAVVGVPGEGLNVEQRKRLTIGVELVARPQLLLFLDEPTSGLDSQTSWSICDLMEKLAKHGQAILCTIHQPSAMLFQRFDRLLFLVKGGKPVYFGEIGKNSEILTSYFERNGATPCPVDANPAEWILETVGAAPGSHTDIEWPQVWRDSPELGKVHERLAEMKDELPALRPVRTNEADMQKSSYREFAAPFMPQLWEVQKRVFSQYWRTPSYIYSKCALSILTALFIGFSFYKAPTSLQGLQNQMFSIFMLLTIFGNLVQQIMPNFVVQRALYEVRERPSKAYSWKAFIIANIIVEVFWNTLQAVFIFVCWYFPIGLYNNTAIDGALVEREGLMFLLIWAFLMFTSTFAHMVIVGVESAETGGNIANLLFSLCLIFCGVLAGPTALPGFWIFMYRLSPFTYLVSSMLSVGVANTLVVCSDVEILRMEPPRPGQTCGEYLGPFTNATGGYVSNPTDTSNCGLCPVGNTNVFLQQVNANYEDRWRNFGILWAYVMFNAAMAVFLYWLARVPKNKKKDKVGGAKPVEKKEKKEKKEIS